MVDADDYSEIKPANKPALYLAVMIAGAALALMANRLWTVEKSSYFIVIIGGILGLCLASFFLRRLEDFLMVVFFFGISVTGFVKTFFLINAGYSDRDTALLLASGVAGIGPVDLIIAALYVMWFIDIFIKKNAEPLSWKWPDIFVGMLMLAYVLSSLGAPEPKVAWFSILFHIRYVLVYFYISRRFQWRHVTMLIVVFSIVAILESVLAYYQYSTGKMVSLAMDRGSGTELHSQYVVPGIESRNRSTGTCNESHGFGLYSGLLALYMFVWMFNRAASRGLRFLTTGSFLMISLALICSFSRSAWLSAAIALVLVWIVYFAWGERQLVLPTLFVGLAGIALFPWALTILLERFTSAEGLVQARFEQYPVAWSIWKDHFLFGYGAGNYMWALDTYNKNGALELPVHNVFLWLAAETGLLGVVAYFGLAGGIMCRAFKYVRKHPGPVSNCALIVLATILMSLLDGLTDPLYREPVVYMMFWLSLGIGVALERLHATAPKGLLDLTHTPNVTSD